MGDSPASGTALNRALELMHFGFRALVSGPDRLLARHGLSRAHHRLLYFIARHPGCNVHGLVAAMKVSKQAIAGPLRDLARGKWVAMPPDPADRRVKRLSLSAAGRKLEERVSGVQREMFAAAFKEAGPQAEKGWREVMELLGEPLRRGGR